MCARNKLFLVLVFSICFTLAVSSSSNSSSSSEDDPEEAIIKKWDANFARMKKLMKQAIKIALPYFMESVSGDELMFSNACKHTLFQWISDLRVMKPYALRMADSSAKMVDGILTGTLSSFGSYDQCIETKLPYKNLVGQYCTIEAWPSLPPKPRFYAVNQRLEAFKRFENDTGMMGEFTKHLQLFYNFPFRIGICVPSSCSREDIYNITQLVAKKLFPANIKVPRCEVQEETVIENYQIPILCVFGILTCLVICGTVTDYILNRSEEDPKSVSKKTGYGTKCVLSFSLISNWKMLMNLDAGADSLSILHGIRFFTMCWIIFGHTYFHLNFNVLKYLQITIELISQFAFNTITNASLLVDNFFFISGLLFIYVAMDIEKKTGKIPNPLYFAIHRIWRFLPIMMFFVGCSTLLPLLGDGPMFHENIDPVVDGCKSDWWANFIFINNLYRSTPRGCLSYSWYLAADMQVYLLCIPLVILIMKKPVIGLWTNFAVMLLSVIGVGIHNYVRDLPPTLLFTRADIDQRNGLMMEAYYPPLHHLGPHCLGIFVGYYLRMNKSPKNMHWILHVLAWILTFTFTSASLYGVHPWNVGGSGTGKVATVLYASLSRMSWTLGLAWITIACTTGCGGFLTSILGWKALIPFSRLTFMVYMVHPLVQYLFYATLRDGIQARNVLAIFMFCGFVIASYTIAVVACLILEAPFVRIGKVMFDIEEAVRKKEISVRSLFTGKEIRNGERRNGSKPGHLQTIENGIPNGTHNGETNTRMNYYLSNGNFRSRDGAYDNELVCRL